MRLEFSGTVETGDPYRVTGSIGFDDEKDGAIFIGGRDLVVEVDEAIFDNPVIVSIEGECFEGALKTEQGWGYSEYTPMDADELKVGTNDILDKLEALEGTEVTVVVRDERN